MYLLFDLGATNTRLAVSHDGLKLDRHLTVPTDGTAGGQAAFVAAAREIVGSDTVRLAAGGAPGTIDRKAGVLLHSPNLPDWGRVDLGHLFKRAFGAPLLLENDTALVGLGEVTHGSGHRRGIVAYVTISTGVNGVRLIDGQIDRSTYGFELGSQIVEEIGDRIITLEEQIGGRSLQQRYGRLPKQIDDPAVWRRETRHLARALYNLMLEWSPEQIVLGGSMMRDIPLKWLQEELEALPKVFRDWPELTKADLDDKGGLYGALALISQYQ